jgi:hypothetical protein
MRANRVDRSRQRNRGGTMKSLLAKSAWSLLALGTWACQSTGADRIREARGPGAGMLWSTDVYTVSATPPRIDGESVVIDSVDVIGRDAATDVELKLTVVLFEDVDGDLTYDPQRDRLRRELTGVSPRSADRPPCIGIFGISTARAERLMAWIRVDVPGRPTGSTVLALDGAELVFGTKPA